MTNDVWVVVLRPEDRSDVGSRSIYKIKYVANNNVEKYKARFAAKEYAQQEGIDYEETFAPVSKYTSIWSIISLATQMGSLGLIEGCKRNLAAKFDMQDLGLIHYFLGLEVWQKDREIFLSQGIYVTNIVKRFRMHDCRPMSTPMITNWKKIDASDDKDVDPTLYR
eukprot:PITA_11882